VDDVLPHLPLAEHMLYLRLFRFSHARHSSVTKYRNEDLAIPMRTLTPHPASGVEGTEIQAVGQDRVAESWATTFTVHLVCQLRYRPVFPHTETSRQ